MRMQFLYKLCSAAEWAAARETGFFTGSAVDHADGFIHLSAAHQVRETAARHFAGRIDLVLVALAESDISGLKWELSRGGAPFPHVYGGIQVNLARWVKPLPLEGGHHRFPDEVPE